MSTHAKRKRPRPAAMKPSELRALIEASGLTQGEAAEKLGVARKTVVRWVNGSTPIGRQAAAYIAANIKPS